MVPREQSICNLMLWFHQSPVPVCSCHRAAMLAYIQGPTWELTPHKLSVASQHASAMTYHVKPLPASKPKKITGSRRGTHDHGSGLA